VHALVQVLVAVCAQRPGVGRLAVEPACALNYPVVTSRVLVASVPIIT
jgi:hypothetical protein